MYDAFFTEGPKILYRLALFILKSNESKLVKVELDKFFSIFTELIKTIKHKKLMEGALKIKITRKQIVEYEKEYEENPDQEILGLVRA